MFANCKICHKFTYEQKFIIGHIIFEKTQHKKMVISIWIALRVASDSPKTCTAQKMKFCMKDFFSKCDQIRRKLRILVTLTEEILNGKLHFLCRHSILKYKTASVDNDTQIYWLFESISCCMRVVFNCSFKLMNYRRFRVKSCLFKVTFCRSKLVNYCLTL